MPSTMEQISELENENQDEEIKEEIDTSQQNIIRYYKNSQKVINFSNLAIQSVIT